MGRFVSALKRAAFPLFRGVRAASLADVLDDTRAEAHIADWHLDPGAGSLWDSLAVACIARDSAPRVLFEIGTGHGRGALTLALNTPEAATIYTLDTSTAAHVGSVYRGHPAGRKVVQLTGDSAAFDFSPYRGRCDLVFVDGDHSFEGVTRDTATALSILAPGGRVLWDDFDPGWPGVVKAVKRCPVARRVRHIAGTKLAFFDSRQSVGPTGE